jgi:glucose/arabinose dehydrogenase
VTHSREYPIAAAAGAGRDRVSILEDTNGDGRADRFTTFADSLNIPIGIAPMRDGAIVYSIPNVYRMIDRDGDGRADERRVLYGPFDYDDTHGMVNSLLRSYDGWIHAGHGFSNRSTVAGTDGDSIRMTSGNTFRFRDDGTRVEQLTWGRVNPSGCSSTGSATSTRRTRTRSRSISRSAARSTRTSAGCRAGSAGGRR